MRCGPAGNGLNSTKARETAPGDAHSVAEMGVRSVVFEG